MRSLHLLRAADLRAAEVCQKRGTPMVGSNLRQRRLISGSAWGGFEVWELLSVAQRLSGRMKRQWLQMDARL